jgi:Helix-turn-helix domain
MANDTHPVDKDEELWTADDVAAYLKIHVETVRTFEKTQGLPFHHLGTRRSKRYFPSEIRAWVRNRWICQEGQASGGKAE